MCCQGTAFDIVMVLIWLMPARRAACWFIWQHNMQKQLHIRSHVATSQTDLFLSVQESLL